MTTKTYKLTGIVPTGHIDPSERLKSFRYDWSTGRETRIVEFDATEEGGFLRITRGTELECDAELEGQLSDGIFENWKVEDVVSNPIIYVAYAHKGMEIAEINVSRYLDDSYYAIERDAGAKTQWERDSTQYMIYGFLVDPGEDAVADWCAFNEKCMDELGCIADEIFRREVDPVAQNRFDRQGGESC